MKSINLQLLIHFPSTRNYTSTISITRNVGSSSSGTTLTPGTYYLHVQAKDQYDVESEVEAASFTLRSTSTRILEVVGLVSDTTPTSSKTWNWNCDNPPCTFRSVINRSPSHTLSGAYNNDTDTMKDLLSGEQEGVYYLHVQARDSDNVESEAKRVSFILQRERDFVSTLLLELIDPDDPDGTQGTPRHPANGSELPLYPEKNPKIKVILDGDDLEADHQIQFYSSLTCNSSRTLSDPITLAIDDGTTDINEDTTQGVNIDLHPGVHNIYAGVVNGNELQCSREDLEYVVYNPVVAGHEFTCHLTSTGNTSSQVNCWGSGTNGRLGTNTQSSSSPSQVMLKRDTYTNPISTAKFITTGGYHACAILDDNSVKCWGQASYGRLGNGDDNNDIGDSSNELADAEVVKLGTGRVVKVISAGGSHTCAILDNDQLKCWGRNNEGQLGLAHDDDLGDDSDEMGDDLDPVNLGTGRIAKAIATGDSHTCAILDNGDVKCWGRNDEGQLGLGHTNDYGDDSSETVNKLAKVNLGAKAKAIAAGGNHTCAILDNDSLKCWGENDEGQLGLGDTDNYGNDETTFTSIDLGEWDHDNDGTDTTPTPEVPLTAKAIAAGEDHTCVILSNDQVKCWGLNDKGQLGQGNINNYGGENIPLGEDAGEDDEDEVDESDIAKMNPVDLGDNVSDPYTAIAIAAGDKHTCVSLNSITSTSDDGVVEGHIKCWGNNNNYQLSIGNNMAPFDIIGNEINETNDISNNVSSLDFL